MSREPGVSVVICTHDPSRYALLAAAIASVREQTQQPTELLVVVDHHDALQARVLMEHPDLVTLANEEAPGLSGARNTGVRHATGRIVAFLDDDARADPDWLARLADAYDADDVLGVGGAALPEWHSQRPRWFPEEYLWVVGCSYRGLPAERATVRNLIGANMSVRRSVFDRVGTFDHGVGRGRGLPLGCEETELCIRAAAGIPGGRFVYEPAATVHHAVTPQRTTLGYFLRRCLAEGISKAYVVRLAGVGNGMRSERAYVSRTLPRGVAYAMKDAVRGDWSGGQRAAMMVIGLVAFAAGYARGVLRFTAR